MPLKSKNPGPGEQDSNVRLKAALSLEVFIVRSIAFHCGFHGGMNNF